MLEILLVYMLYSLYLTVDHSIERIIQLPSIVTIVTMSPPCTVSDYIARYLVKIADLNLPLYLAYPLGVPQSNFTKVFGVRKLEYVCYCVVLFA